MHLIIAAFGIIMTVIGIIWRINAARQAARDLGDLAGEAANLPRKMRFRSKSKNRGLDTIEDPREAAAVLLLNMARARDGEVSAKEKAAILDEMSQAFETSETDTAALYSRAVWHSSSVQDPIDVVRRMTDFVFQQVSAKDMDDLAAMMSRVMAAGGSPAPEQTLYLHRFRDRAGLTES